MISDAALKEAANAINQSMLEALPKPEECTHIFSAAFERKMRKLIRRANHPIVYKVLSRAACVLIVLALSAGLFLTFHTEARAAVVDWIKEKVDEFYHYFAPEKETNVPLSGEYCLGWVPEGYTLLFSNTTDGKTEGYVNSSGQVLQFQCVSSSSGPLLAGYGEYEEQQVTIGEQSAEIYLAKDCSNSSSIILSSNNGNALLCISGHLNKAELIKIAENVFLQERP